MADPTPSTSKSRRQFLARTAAATAAFSARPLLGVPAVATDNKSGSKLVIGEGDYRYEVDHNWAKLPKGFSWQVTHDVAIDSEGLAYVIHNGDSRRKDHPSIFVFDPDGKCVRSFGQEFQGGGHGLEVRNEGGQDFVYVSANMDVKCVAKLDTSGEKVWELRAPMQSGIYREGEDTSKEKEFGRDRFQPTNIAFLEDGGFLLADGYGSYRIHRYDAQGKWVSHWGKLGKGPGELNLPHGIWMDHRGDGEPLVIVADRLNARLQWFTTDGEPVKMLEGFTLPANVDIRGELMLVPDLLAQVVLLDGENKVVARLGEDPEWAAEVGKMKLRSQPKQWRDGRFVHPHDACFDKDGNILGAEWVDGGRVTKLRRV